MPIEIPFIRFPDFLTDEENRKLFKFALANKDSYQPALTYGPKGSGDVSMDNMYRNQMNFFPGANDKKVFWDHVSPLIPEVIEKFGIQGGEIERFSIQISASNDAHFGKPHIDALKKNKFSFVYYLHGNPKNFTGGELLIYANDPEEAETPPESVTINPDNNLLVAFPSWWYHEIKTVQCKSGEFRDSRFAVTSWVTYME